MLQASIAAITCIGGGFLSPMLLYFNYNAYEIGVTMTIAALASALIKPFWGYIHDKYSCSKQIVIIVTAVGCLFFVLLVRSNGTQGIVEIAVMGLYMTVMSMVSFIDSWAIRLVSDGYSLNYGTTRSGGSFVYAVTAVIFGIIMSRFGINPSIYIILGLLLIQILIVCKIPNPLKQLDSITKPKAIDGFQYLIRNKPYLLLLATYFLSSIAMCATESFFSVLITDLGGTEKEVGYGLFLQAMAEIPIMFFYSRIKKRLNKGPSFFIAVSLCFYGLKCIGLGFAPSYQFAIAVTLINGLAFGLFLSASVDYILKYVHHDYLATAYLFSSALGSSLGAVVGNFVDGLIAEYYGVNIMLRIASLFTFLAATLIIFLGKEKHVLVMKEVQS